MKYLYYIIDGLYWEKNKRIFLELRNDIDNFRKKKSFYYVFQAFLIWNHQN